MAARIELKQEYSYSMRVQQIIFVVLVCSVIIFVLMSVCLMSSYWITAEGFRQGLLYLCIEERDPQTRSRYEELPFDLNREELEPGCYLNRDVGYLKVCTLLCLVTKLAALASACLTGLSLRYRGAKKISYLKFSICTTLVALLCDLSILVIYPIQFKNEIERSNRDVWELNGAYGLACGAGILAAGSVTLLLAALSWTRRIYETPPARI